MDVAKSTAFGGDLAGAARPMIKTLEVGGKKGLLAMIHRWEMELRGAMFLTGSRTVKELREQRLVLRS